MTPSQALAFVAEHGVVLQAARGPVPNLAEAIAGGPIKGSWWGHPKGREIFAASQIIADCDDILVCRLVDARITYVHRRLWPALVKLSARFPKTSLARVGNEHTARGAHRAVRQAYPKWVPEEVRRDAERLPVKDAESLLAMVLRPASGS